MRYLSMFSMFKGETKWLKEWIEYYRLVGFEHFYLHTNEEDLRKPIEVLRPYMESGLVELRQSPTYDFSTQTAAYTEVARRVATNLETVWLAFMDLDEFLLPIETETVPEFLKEFEDYAALGVNWRVFGSSSLAASPKSQVRAFLRRAPDDFGPNQHVKVIVRPERVGVFDTPHSIVSPGFVTVNESHEVIRGYLSAGSAQRIRLNHYCVRSKEDFEIKRLRTTPGNETWEFFDSHDRNELFDDLIVRKFGVRLSDALGNGS